MKIKHLLLVVFALCALNAQGQEPTGGIQGQTVVREGRSPIGGVKVTLMPGGIVRYTGDDGRFSFDNLPEGQYTVKFEAYEFEDEEVNVRVAKTGREVTVPMAAAAATDAFQDLDTVDFDIEGSSDEQYSSSNLSASKDLFSNIAGYKFSEMRFNARGMRNETVFLNGIEFNDALTGYSPWSLWTGLNDATRNQESQAGVGIFEYGVGGFNGNTNINARASQVRKGARVSLAGGTNSYLLRVMATYGSGLLDNGWSYAFSVSTRQGRHAWVDGVYYNTWGYFGSVEKRFGGGHSLGLTFFGAPTERGAQQATTDEVYYWTGNNFYNPNWGMQDGKMRNARVRDNHEPVAMLNYTYNDPKGKLILNAAMSYRFGKNGYSAIDWYNNSDPRPDYYRKLPSYYTPTFGREYGEQYIEATRMWIEQDPRYTQINWDDLINQNRASVFYPGEGTRPTGVTADMTRSRYIIEERRTDQNDLNFKAQLDHQISPRSKFTYGLNYRWNRTEYFKTIKDLLGGDYYIDLDNFADRDYPSGSQSQNDLARPNRALYEGDKWGYDYYANVREGKLWTVYRYEARRFSISGALEAGFNNMWRDGLVEKGLFPTYVDGVEQPVGNRSLGESDRLEFFTYKVKAGANYNISGAHQVTANVAYAADAPYFQNSFVSPRTRNEAMPGLVTEKTLAADLVYNMRYSFLKMRVAGYYTLVKDLAEVISFYDDSHKAFTNFAMNNIDQRYMGVEFAAEVPIIWGISFNTAINLGSYQYTSNPTVTQTVDNSAVVLLSNEPVYYKNLYVESTPQWAFNFGLEYQGPGNWWAGIDFNMYDRLYLSMNPLYRTQAAFTNMQYAVDDQGNSMEYQLKAAMMAQEEFPLAFVMNANVSKLWYLNKGQLGMSLEVKNILNNTGIKTGGYEQSRLWRENNYEWSTDYYHRFPSKYFYLYGINFYLNLYYRF